MTLKLDLEYSIPSSLTSLIDSNKRSLDISSSYEGINYNKQTGRLTVEVNDLYNFTSNSVTQTF